MRDEIAEKSKIIRALLFDVDGVMTDGKIYCSESGETLKVFNAADGLGIALLRDFNVITGVISGRDSTALRFRLEDLNIRHVYLCLLYTSPSPRDLSTSRMPSSA